MIPPLRQLLVLVLVLTLLPLLTAPFAMPGPAAAQDATPAATPLARDAAAPCDGSPTAARLLYSTWPELTPEGELVVVNGRGEVERRLPAPAFEYGQTTSLPNHALLWTTDDTIVVADAATGAVRPLDLPPDVVSDLYPLPAPGWNGVASGYWVFGGPRQSHAILADLRTGATTDLAAAITARGDPFPELLTVMIAPNDGGLLLWTGPGLYWLDPAAPETLTALDTGNGLATPGFFQADGSLVYSRVRDSQSEVVIVAPDGAERVIGLGGNLGPRRAILLPLPDTDAALLSWAVGETATLTVTAHERLDLATGRATFLLSLPEAVGLPLIAGDGAHIVVGGYGPVGIQWQWVDVMSGARTPLPALDGLLTLGNGFASDYALFVPLDALSGREGVPGNRYVGLDLNAGIATELLQQRAEYTYSLPVSGPQQRTVLIAVAAAERTALLALDLAAGETRTLTTAPVTGGLLSPDGCWVLPGVAAGLPAEPELLPVGVGAPVALPGGAGAAVWAAP